MGLYKYKFIVDGEWACDPEEPKISNNLGSFNNIKEVYPTTAYTENQDFEGPQTKIVSRLKEKKLQIIGSWDNWGTSHEMK